MNRRTFFSLLLRGAATLPWISLGGIKTAQTTGGVRIQQSPLAGFQYHDGARCFEHLRIGAPLALVREPDNPFDARAVRVEWRGRKLGYVPRMENTAVAQMLDRGAQLSARIVELRQSRDPWQRIRFEVVLDG
ncbi:MAG: HIRAN protein [Zetaproteobacteria bacterium]|nr:MAG: HIRAN protein [Zetaproteobacteria bacterium]